jgi:hypothetical protein
MIFGSLAQYGIDPHLKVSKLRLLGLWIEPDRKHVLSGSDVPTDRRISLWWYRNMILPSKFFF